MHSPVIPPADSHQHWRCHRLAGAILIVLGVGLALSGQARDLFTTAWDIIPLLLVLSGLLRILQLRHSGSACKGVLHLILGIWLYLCIEPRWGWSFHDSWPVLLILLGARLSLRKARPCCAPIRQGETQ